MASELAFLLKDSPITVAVAESLTGGTLSSRLSAAPDASLWFRGGLVAYSPQVKFQVLNVPPGPVVTPECAEIMAEQVAQLLQADLSVAVTGVGGPDPQEGKPPGTVCCALWTRSRSTSHTCQFPGDPEEVVMATTIHALEMLVRGAQELLRHT